MQKMSLGTNSWGIESQIWIGENEIITTQKENVSPLLDLNQRLRNGEADRKKSLRHVASIPLTTYYAWRKEWKKSHAYKWEWKTWMSMKLRDRDFSKLRTSDMKI